MKLKFIGANGSMGLEHGKLYKVSLRTAGKYLVVHINKGLCREITCPYSSMQAFADNWALEDRYGKY